MTTPEPVEITKLKEVIASLEGHVKKLSKLESRLDYAETCVSELRRRNEGLQANLKTANAAYEEKCSENERFRVENGRLREEIAELLANADADAFAGQRCKSEIDKLRLEAENWRIKYLDHVSTILKNEDTITNLQKEKTSNQASIDRLVKEVNTLKMCASGAEQKARIEAFNDGIIVARNIVLGSAFYYGENTATTLRYIANTINEHIKQNPEPASANSGCVCLDCGARVNPSANPLPK